MVFLSVCTVHPPAGVHESLSSPTCLSVFVPLFVQRRSFPAEFLSAHVRIGCPLKLSLSGIPVLPPRQYFAVLVTCGVKSGSVVHRLCCLFRVVLAI